MKTIALIILISFFAAFSLSYADSLEKAYSLYYQGNKQEAIKTLKDYVDEHPNPKALYFLGYMYYEKGEFGKARRYFEDAYLIDPNFSPVKR